MGVRGLCECVCVSVCVCGGGGDHYIDLLLNRCVYFKTVTFNESILKRRYLSILNYAYPTQILMHLLIISCGIQRHNNASQWIILLLVAMMSEF